MKYISAVIFLLFFINSSGQSNKIYGEVHVESFIYKSDTFDFKIPKVIKFNRIGKTPIVILGTLKQNEFAVQFEILKSSIGHSEYYMLGKVFFIKQSNEWKEITRFDYNEIYFNDGPLPSEIPNIKQGIYGAEESESGFEFGSWYVFYKN